MKHDKKEGMMYRKSSTVNQLSRMLEWLLKTYAPFGIDFGDAQLGGKGDRSDSHEHRPDVIFLDIEMPKNKNGFDMLVSTNCILTLYLQRLTTSLRSRRSSTVLNYLLKPHRPGGSQGRPIRRIEENDAYHRGEQIEHVLFQSVQ